MQTAWGAHAVSLWFVKYLHIVSATVILGTGAGIAFFMLMAHRTGNAAFIGFTARTVVIADILFTATAIILQPVTGFFLMRGGGWSFGDSWIVVSLGLYLFAGTFWIPVLWMQARMRDLAVAASTAQQPLPIAYHRLFRVWFVFGFPAFAAVLAILALMILKPVLY